MLMKPEAKVLNKFPFCELTICSPEISKLEESKCTAKGATVENWKKKERKKEWKFGACQSSVIVGREQFNNRCHVNIESDANINEQD